MTLKQLCLLYYYIIICLILQYGSRVSIVAFDTDDLLIAKISLSDIRSWAIISKYIDSQNLNLSEINHIMYQWTEHNLSIVGLLCCVAVVHSDISGGVWSVANSSE